MFIGRNRPIFRVNETKKCTRHSEGQVCFTMNRKEQWFMLQSKARKTIMYLKVET